jgi:hypothetical protein
MMMIMHIISLWAQHLRGHLDDVELRRLLPGPVVDRLAGFGSRPTYIALQAGRERVVGWGMQC